MRVVLFLFGMVLPIVISMALFVVLMPYIYFEVEEAIRKVTHVKVHPPTIEYNRDLSFGILLKILKETASIAGSSDTLRNLGLLLAASIGWVFVYWRTKIAKVNAEATKQSTAIAEQNARNHATEQLSSENSTIRLNSVLTLEKIAETQEEERDQIRQTLATTVRTLTQVDDAQENQEFSSNQKTAEEQQKNFEAIDLMINALSRITALYPNKKLTFCNLQRIDLRGLSLLGVNFPNFNLSGVNLAGVFLFNANFSRAYLSSADLSGARLDQANFRDAHLDSANLIGARLCGANLRNARLDSADFNNARLNRADIRDARLHWTNLSGARLDQANFRNALLNWTNLSGARLDGANFKGASFLMSNISDADFRGVKGLTQKQINETFFWKEHPPLNLPDNLELPPEKERPTKDLSFWHTGQQP